MRTVERVSGCWNSENRWERDTGKHVGTNMNEMSKHTVALRFMQSVFCAPELLPPANKLGESHIFLTPYLGREDYMAASGCLDLHRWRPR